MRVSRVMRLLAMSVLVFRAETTLAQDGASSGPEVLLERARAAFNDLQFVRADSLAREVLATGTRLRRSVRIQALHLVAAANYPEVNSEQRAAPARSALSELVKLDLGATIPRELSWPGLDSLYSDVLKNTFAMSVSARRDNPIEGVNGVSPIRVRTNRPATLVLQARSRDGIEVITLDTVHMSIDTTLRLRVGRDGRPILRGGEYDFLVQASDPQTRETITRRFEGIAIVPSIDYVPTPSKLDESEYLPTRAAPQRAGAIVGGVLVGVATFALGTALRQSDPIKAHGQVDTRFQQVGVLITLGTIGAGWYDRGRLLDRNVRINLRREREFATKMRLAKTENDKRAATYRASIALDPEGR